MHVFTALLLVATVFLNNGIAAYRTCGSTNTRGVITNIQSQIDRLMEFRTPEWAWQNTPEAFLALQLTNQAAFFGRDKTLAAMKNEILSEWESMNLGKFGLYVMAVKSACKDPTSFGGKNLVLELNRRLKLEFPNKGQMIPEARWYQYGLAVGAICVAGQIIRPSMAHMFARAQNEDGSFGSSHSVDDTAQVFLALSCVLRQRKAGWTQVVRVLEQAKNFLQRSAVKEGDLKWIGNKYASPGAILALMEAGNMDKDMCNAVMKSLDKPYISSEPESAFNQRLPALAGRSYLALLDGWHCIKPGPIPDGYEPTFDPNQTKDCQPSIADETPSLISVTLKVFISINADIKTDPPTLEVTLNDVIQGSTLLDTMQHAQCLGMMRFKSVMTSWGASIVSVEGIAAVSENREFWSLLHENGDWLSVGAGQYQPSNGETIILKLATW